MCDGPPPRLMKIALLARLARRRRPWHAEVAGERKADAAEDADLEKIASSNAVTVEVGGHGESVVHCQSSLVDCLDVDNDCGISG